LLIFLRDGRLRVAGDLTVLDQPDVASVMKPMRYVPSLPAGMVTVGMTP
jgi:hypothetical protein